MALRRRLAPCAVAGALAAAAFALSPGSLAAAKTHTTKRTSVGSDLRWWITEDTGSVVPIVPFFHFEVVPNVFLDFDFPIAPQSGGRTFSPPYEEKSRFGLGNPMLGAHYATGDKDAASVFFAGARIGIPLASLGDVDSDRANDLASASNGHADFYHWVPELFPIVGTFGFELRPRDGLWIRLPVDLMMLIPTTDRRELKGGAAARFEIEGQSESGFGGGGAIQIVASNGFRTRDDDHAQTALEPYFVFDNDKFFMRFGLMFGADEPLGPWFNKGGLFAADLRIGGALR